VLNCDDHADRGGVAAPAVVVQEVPLCGHAIDRPRGFAVIAVSTADVQLYQIGSMGYGSCLPLHVKVI
jgi:hypothetical protein